jgi:hypothetical protein
VIVAVTSRAVREGAACRRALHEQETVVMVTNSTNNKQTLLGRDQAIVNGIQKHLQGIASLPLDGATYSPADLVKLVQSRATQTAVVAAANAAWRAAVVAQQELNAKLTPVIRSLRQYVLNACGSGSTVLADFGFTAAARKPLTPEQKVARAAKAKATREARHTMGPVQKKKVTGATAAATAAPVPVPAPSPAPGQPAPKAT